MTCLRSSPQQRKASQLTRVSSRPNTSVRRLLLAGSLQVHAVDLQELSALWVLQSYRRNQEDARPRRRVNTGARKPRRRGVTKKRRKKPERKSPRGGTCRAFVHLVCGAVRGRRPTLPSSAKYNDHKTRNSELYQRAVRRGRLGTRLARARPAKRAPLPSSPRPGTACAWR